MFLVIQSNCGMTTEGGVLSSNDNSVWGVLSSDDNMGGRSTNFLPFSNFELDTYSKTRLVSREFQVRFFDFDQKKYVDLTPPVAV